MKNWLRWLSACLAVLLLCPCVSVAEETPPRLIIAVEYASNACNIAAEEAFLKMHPDAVIEYRLYSQEQFNSMLMTGNADFDLALLYRYDASVMAEKGYLETLDEAIGLTEYPEALIDVERFVTLNGKMFMLPKSISQEFWIWNGAVARQCGIEYPVKDGVWTWEEYCELSKKFPVDTDGDGEPDLYFQSGSSFASAPLLTNNDAEMFLSFIDQYPQELDRFFEDYFDIFKETFASEGLRPQDSRAKVLIERYAVSTPMTSPGIMLPIPTFDTENVQHLGEIKGWVKAKNAPHSDLANDFLNVLLSDEVLYTYVTGAESSFITKEPPTKRITNYNMRTAYKTCAFEDVDGIQTYCVTAGRTIKMAVAGISRTKYDEAQKFRTQLQVSQFSNGQRDFYDAVWVNLQEWYLGHLDDEGLKENIMYLLGMALGE